MILNQLNCKQTIQQNLLTFCLKSLTLNVVGYLKLGGMGHLSILKWIKEYDNQNIFNFKNLNFNSILPKICLKMFWKGKNYKRPSGICT